MLLLNIHNTVIHIFIQCFNNECIPKNMINKLYCKAVFQSQPTQKLVGSRFPKPTFNLYNATIRFRTTCSCYINVFSSLKLTTTSYFHGLPHPLVQIRSLPTPTIKHGNGQTKMATAKAQLEASQWHFQRPTWPHPSRTTGVLSVHGFKDNSNDHKL